MIFKQFLESSTIHGLGYISSTKRYARLFWILVVISGFTFAGYLIYQSFQSWYDSPVRTTIETRTIDEVRFPKVTVCPPKNTYTNLNYDLEKMDDRKLDWHTEAWLLMIQFVEHFQELDAIEIWEAFNIVQNTDMLEKWYTGVNAVPKVSTNYDHIFTNPCTYDRDYDYTYCDDDIATSNFELYWSGKTFANKGVYFSPNFGSDDFNDEAFIKTQKVEISLQNLYFDENRKEPYGYHNIKVFHDLHEINSIECLESPSIWVRYLY